jgi:hypothetical protein
MLIKLFGFSHRLMRNQISGKIWRFCFQWISAHKKDQKLSSIAAASFFFYVPGKRRILHEIFGLEISGQLNKYAGSGGEIFFRYG